MLKPLEPHSEPKNEFVVCDIENRSDGSVIAIDTAWRGEVGNIEHIQHYSWGEFWEWIIRQGREDKKFRTIYAHNGGGWDWLSLAHYLLNEGKRKRKRVTGVIAGSSMVTMIVTIEKQFSVAFCDSLQLLRSSLDKLSKTFLGRGKVETGGKLPEWYWDNDRETFWRYLRTDTENLLLVLERALEKLRENVAEIDTFGRTIGSTAMKVFRTMGLPYEISVPWEPYVKDFLREGYSGGRVEVFRMGNFDRVNVYDINSLYPSVMQDEKVPTSERGYWVEKFYPKQIGCYRIRFKQRRRDIPPVLLVNGEGAYSGSGTFYSPELKLLREVDPKATIEVEKGYLFQDTEILFKDYVQRLYELRLTDPDGPLSLLCKFLLNSLYGKFGQQAVRDQIIAVESFQDVEDLVLSAKERGTTEPRPLNEFAGVWSVEKETVVAFEHVGIAGIITSAARVRLYKGLLDAGTDNIIYCDTDSVHTRGVLSDSLLGTELGKYKCEFSGAGSYAGKKLYALRSKDGTEKVRAKGVSVGGRNGHRLSFSDVQSICEGQAIVCTFHRPPSPMQVFKGEEPCIFKPKTRTLRNLHYAGHSGHSKRHNADYAATIANF